ncbi:hypothetical protein PAV_11c00620 [Paenibacillus alvei DSM 29]|nr:hypothetical protein PAV_11c00620 [Paenibacillus alvei DSM 29]
MGFLRAKDTISGQEGRAYATINGRIEEMFYVKSLEAKVEKEKPSSKHSGAEVRSTRLLVGVVAAA